MSSYLGNQLRVEVQSPPEDALQAVVGLQSHLRGVRLLIHEVKKRLHLPPGEGQHRVQVIHHPVLWRESTKGERKTDRGTGRYIGKKNVEQRGRFPSKIIYFINSFPHSPDMPCLEICRS